MDTNEQGSRTYATECARARGEQEIPPDETPVSITGAYCDYNARGKCRAHWFRLVWRDGEWQYFSERLKPTGVRADSRHQSERGDVWTGEIIAEHDRGGPVNSVAVVLAEPKDGKHLLWLDYSKRRDGQLAVALPDGTSLTLPDPRRKS